MGILKDIIRPKSDATPNKSHKPANAVDKLTGWKNRTVEQEEALMKQLEENKKDYNKSLGNNTWRKSKGKH